MKTVQDTVHHALSMVKTVQYTVHHAVSTLKTVQYTQECKICQTEGTLSEWWGKVTEMLHKAEHLAAKKKRWATR